MYQVMFIGKVKDLNEEYQQYSDSLYDTARCLSGFVALESEVIDGVEITISKWKGKEDVLQWAKDPLHVEAKKQVHKWYEWYKSYHFS